MNKLFLNIEDFYAALQNGEFDEPLALAAKLQTLSDAAWLEVERLYQPSLLIEP
ncbi:hypothetical protein NIES4075_57270 [Tolypothrix sp. NIES-4075]|uniref:hypothetical protein n=1 Tax=Tolypothrix sp. NIES-4075 TaxID=2005459 RepID=UPI000B63F173|nr:hypothetical protein [Tolypothrix sp. NIES-4075]GAX44708.1 hypothetical protein NIES4075_57270 [Tolypothrix sp. NIES-4075]